MNERTDQFPASRGDIAAWSATDRAPLEPTQARWVVPQPPIQRADEYQILNSGWF
jgi:hypothetical protein